MNSILYFVLGISITLNLLVIAIFIIYFEKKKEKKEDQWESFWGSLWEVFSDLKDFCMYL